MTFSKIVTAIFSIMYFPMVQNELPAIPISIVLMESRFLHNLENMILFHFLPIFEMRKNQKRRNPKIRKISSSDQKQGENTKIGKLSWKSGRLGSYKKPNSLKICKFFEARSIVTKNKIFKKIRNFWGAPSWSTFLVILFTRFKNFRCENPTIPP